jgi:dTDP-4-dehydrorhamnose 3,5-epimerase
VTIAPTAIDGLAVLGFERHADERGSFARVFDRDAFLALGLCADFPQHSVASNARRGIVRGLHYQTKPYAEHKVVRCTRGSVWDVVADVRRGSPTYGRWEAFELSADAPRMLYVAAGLAHGYQALTDGAELHYLISAPYAPDHAAGVHWRDGRLAISWPLPGGTVGARDAGLPALADAPDSAP